MERFSKVANCLIIMMKAFTRNWLVYLLIAVAMPLCAASIRVAQAQDLTIHVKDYVTMPMTGDVESKGSNSSLLARESYLREEPGGGQGETVHY